ncbi:MAG: hypothetical protein ACR2LV_08500 [Solirubrobacteraceae bacterium]
MSDLRHSAPPAVGDPAPPLELAALDGSSFRLEDLRGRPLLLTFLRHAG